MSPVRRKNERLAALFILGCLALNHPLLSLFNRPRILFGVPLLHLYLFGFWLLFILLLALTLQRTTAKPPARTKDNPDAF